MKCIHCQTVLAEGICTDKSIPTAWEHTPERCREVMTAIVVALRAQLSTAKTALEWYASPENNGKRGFVEIDGVDVSKHRWIDEDEASAHGTTRSTSSLPLRSACAATRAIRRTDVSAIPIGARSGR